VRNVEKPQASKRRTSNTQSSRFGDIPTDEEIEK
jgi:hypothetical protein